MKGLTYVEWSAELCLMAVDIWSSVEAAI